MSELDTKPNPNPFSEIVPVLFREHYNHLKGSAISDDIIKERGYKSVLGRVALVDAGFSKAQQRYPGILIPLYGVDGKISGYQYRPDKPRTDNNSKRVIKYENPTGASVHLDVLPRSRKQLGDPKVPLWFTEGIKKVDSLTSAGVCAIGLTGVWGFKGKNQFGQSTILADFDYIALKYRHCYLCFDSDYVTNPHVRAALERLSEHLKRKGAVTHIIQLPGGPDGKKYGADDYLATGKTIQDILNCEIRFIDELDKEPLYELSNHKYKIEDGQICSIKYSAEEGGEEIHPLCNFNVGIKEVVIKDDGMEQSGYFKISGTNKSGYHLESVEVPIANFNTMNWVTSAWHINAIIESGQIVKDRLREAIMLQSQDAPIRYIYTHLGWRKVGDQMVFLSSSGGLGDDGIEVEVEPQLENYYIPRPDADPVTAMKRSLDFLFITPDRPHVTFPLWACMYLAPLADIIPLTFTLWYVGASGTFKSTLTSLALCHFGMFDERHMPASWVDTENHLEKMLFLAKDVPLLIDDWAPGQDQGKAKQLEAKSERIVRAQGNRQGKGRMRSDTSSRPSYIPRGLLITSGEQLPTGHSHNARIYTVELEPKDIDLDALSGAQQNTQHYRMAMSHYLTWLQAKFEDVKKELPAEFLKLRDEARVANIHPRLPEVVALLNIGMRMGTAFAVETGALKKDSATALCSQANNIFKEMAAIQGGKVEDERPARRFIDILVSLKDSGSIIFGNRNDDCVRAAAPNQTLVGWNDSENGHVLLLGQTAYKVVKDYCHRTDEPFTIYYKAVIKDLLRQGYIEPAPATDDNTWRMRVAGAQRRVLKLKKSIINEGDYDEKMDI